MRANIHRMSYLSDFIIPGGKGKTFLLGNDYPSDYQLMLKALRKIKGISLINLNDQVYPHEITVCTDKPVAIKEIQGTTRVLGFHMIPKSFFLQ